MKRKTLCAALALVLGASFTSDSQAQIFVSNVSSQSLGPTGGNGVPADPNAAYSALTGTPTPYIPGTSSNTQSSAVLDDFDPLPSSVGKVVTGLRVIAWSVGTTSSYTARTEIGFWLADGPGGQPGTYLTQGQPVGYILAPTLIQPGANLLTVDLGSTGFVIPAQRLWVGLAYDNLGGSTANGGNLAATGIALFDPPTVGGPGAGQRSAGSFGVPFGQTLPITFLGPTSSSFGFELIVPAPATLSLVSGLLVVCARRRRL
jgi:hypothetical protein